MRPIQLRVSLSTLVLIVTICQSNAKAVTISNDFSLGFGYVSGSWNDSETAGANTTVTGDFTLSVDFAPNTAFTSAQGLDFVGRVLTDDGSTSSQGRSGVSTPFGVTLTATYTGSEPLMGTKLVIDSIEIFAGNHTSGSVSNLPGDSDLIRWQETTVGNEALSSPALDLGAGSSDTSAVSNYDHLVWNPVDVVVPGSSSIRTFMLDTNGDLNAYLDGFEVFGHIEAVPPTPEPSSLLLLGLGTLGLVRQTRRRRRA